MFLENSQDNTCARVSFLIKVQARPATLFKKCLWHGFFPVSFAKFLRTPFLQNASGRQFFYVFKWLSGYLTQKSSWCFFICYVISKYHVFKEVEWLYGWKPLLVITTLPHLMIRNLVVVEISHIQSVTWPYKTTWSRILVTLFIFLYLIFIAYSLSS